MTNTAALGIISAIPEELWYLRRANCKRLAGDRTRRIDLAQIGGSSVYLIAGGDGLRAAASGVQQLISQYPQGPLLGLGIAGAAVDELCEGDLIAASEVYGPDGSMMTADTQLLDIAAGYHGRIQTGVLASVNQPAGPEQKRQLEARYTGPLAVDMESSAWLQTASTAGRQMVVVRCILDPVDELLPQFLSATIEGDAGINRNKLLLYAITHPACWRQLIQLSGRMRRCARILADFASDFVKRLP